MKNLKLSFLLTLFAMTLFVFSCGGGHSHDADGNHTEETTSENNESSDENAEVDLSSPEYASAFICPMHCKGSGNAEAGSCPACGMDYVANENYKSNAAETEGNDGDAGHEGHDHDSHEGHNH